MKLSVILFLLLIMLGSAVQSQVLQRYDIVIDEIMADPTPVVGLPTAEYIEIKNLSGRGINLSGWKLKTATSSSTAFPNVLLLPDSFVVICSNPSAVLLSAYGKVLGLITFPALDNDGSILSLVSKDGITIHAVEYEPSWHSVDKMDGGWSLEMIDTKNPCTGKNNWKSSSDSRGGSPGKINSVNAILSDLTPPRLVKTYNIDSINMIAVFDEPVDSSIASVVSNYNMTSQIFIVSAQPQAPLFNQVILRLSTPIQKSIIYELAVKNITDCKGNEIGTYHTAKAGLGESASAGDIIINEILFNPRPNAFDYIEFYNRSDKIIDISGLTIAGKSTSGILTAAKKISEKPFFIFPGEYFLVTKDLVSIQHEYLVKNPDHILTCILPSYPDDKGTVVFMNSLGKVIDEVSYSDKWHFALISNDEGISLERIDPSANSNDKENWHSASTTIGYGTPTYQNSQYKQTDNLHAGITITSNIISPDNDGLDDFATIDYEIETAGYVANVIIFSADGKMVLRFKKNELLGMKGSWKWDGLDENKRQLNPGMYIIHTEIFNLKGIRKNFKNVIVLAVRKN